MKTLRDIEYRVLVIPVLILVWVITWTMTPDVKGTVDFFATCAQVIPLLLLVLLVEARAFRIYLLSSHPKGYRTDARSHAIMLMLAMLAGEIAALEGVRGAHDNVGLVYAAIAVGLAAIAGLGVFGQGEPVIIDKTVTRAVTTPPQNDENPPARRVS